MCNNVIILFFLLLLTKSGETFRLFSSGAGTYKEARPFFVSSKNLINDYFDGDLTHVFQTINSHTFVFVMYYAHFCGISRRMREPFEKAAAFYLERIPHGNTTLDKFHVKFVAVDCFYHTGQCRKSYKLDYYPHMYLYIKGTRGYQYFGPTITSNLIEFIEKIRMPVIRITNIDEFLDFIVQHESNVLAHFDFSNNLQRQYYSFFVQAALKHIEYDNEHPIRFAVILNQTVIEELSNLFNNTFPESFIILNRLNSTPQIFPNMTNNFTIENLFQWIVNEYKKPYVDWIVPKDRYYSRSPSIDKATIFDALTNHDNLLIFLTSNKLDELKLRYIYFYLSNCNIIHSTLWLKQIEKLYNQSLINLNEHISKTQHNLLSSCCQYVLNQISSVDIYHLCLLNQQLPLLNISEIKTKKCLPILNNLQLKKICYQNYCHQWLKTYASIYQQKLYYNHEIILQKRRNKFYDQSIDIQNQFINNNNNSIEKFQGLLCQMNLTWTFRLINSKYYPNFGQNIGMINNSRAIIILQTKNEQHYILNNNEITTENIYNLIYNVSHNLQSRSLATIPINNINIEHSNRFIELTTDTFHSIVLNTDKHVLVVYYTKWCGFCQSIWPVLYQTKRFFSKFDDLVFTRIQADKHDLPWHLTVYNYPTLILFPAQNKYDSIVFPTSTESITNVSIIKFLLHHLYIDDNVNEHWCQQTNNSFLSMLSSTYIDFSQLSYLVKSFS
ncbi:unnamed protein product [Rotaria sordida]|uniref:Thioredoxin domain-containing protein n=1 Tax=Rotaria sordida TaxID=392033 RepID=A0A818LD97_9BILA|nr:unnamed protein product [Rotaria sordida]CAF3564365.1 unnamed protein product [Rotaria sordida]